MMRLEEFLDHSAEPQHYPAPLGGNDRFPYVVRLAYPTLTKGDFIGCFGVLVTPDVVVSAAHCSGATKAYLMISSINNASDHQAAAAGGRAEQQRYETIGVLRSRLHPGKDPTSHRHDIIMYQLERPSAWVTPAHLDDGAEPRLEGDRLHVVGWGPGPAGQQQRIQDPEVELMSAHRCGKFYPGRIEDCMICASREPDGRGVCQGDSGGPIIAKGDSAAQDVVVGVSSWGFQCRKGAIDNPYPGVYSSVVASMDWIEQTLLEWGADGASTGPMLPLAGGASLPEDHTLPLSPTHQSHSPSATARRDPNGEDRPETAFLYGNNPDQPPSIDEAPEPFTQPCRGAQHLPPSSAVSALPELRLNWFLDHDTRPNEYPAQPNGAALYPYVAMLSYRGKDRDFVGCLGALVRADVIVTAAHCSGAAQAYLPLVSQGSTNTNGAFRAPQQYEVIDVMRQEVHPGKTEFSNSNNLLVYQLRRASHAEHVALADYWSPLEGRSIHVVGWGPSPSGLLRLQDPEVEILSPEHCNSFYDGWVTGDMVCASREPDGRGVCQGDSGGPIVAKGGPGGRDLLVGVSSWGFQCPRGSARAPYPGVYSSIAASFDWVADTMNGWEEARLDDLCSHETKQPPSAAGSSVGDGLEDDEGFEATGVSRSRRHLNDWASDYLTVLAALNKESSNGDGGTAQEGRLDDDAALVMGSEPNAGDDGGLEIRDDGARDVRSGVPSSVTDAALTSREPIPLTSQEPELAAGEGISKKEEDWLSAIGILATSTNAKPESRENNPELVPRAVDQSETFYEDWLKSVRQPEKSEFKMYEHGGKEFFGSQASQHDGPDNDDIDSGVVSSETWVESEDAIVSSDHVDEDPEATPATTSTPASTPGFTFTTPFPTFLTPEPTAMTPLPTSSTTPGSTSSTPMPTGGSTPLPTASTSMPTDSTPEATFWTPEPTSSTPMPTSTPEPTFWTPMPTSTTPMPTSTPEPTFWTPEPTSSTPMPTTTPEPTFWTPEPTSSTPMPTSTPEPTFPTPEPTSSTPMPTTTPEPTFSTRDPTPEPTASATPGPTSSTPEPTFPTPAPTSSTPESTPSPTSTPAATPTPPTPPNTAFVVTFIGTVAEGRGPGRKNRGLLEESGNGGLSEEDVQAYVEDVAAAAKVPSSAVTVNVVSATADRIVLFTTVEYLQTSTASADATRFLYKLSNQPDDVFLSFPENAVSVEKVSVSVYGDAGDFTSGLSGNSMYGLSLYGLEFVDVPGPPTTPTATPAPTPDSEDIVSSADGIMSDSDDDSSDEQSIKCRKLERKECRKEAHCKWDKGDDVCYDKQNIGSDDDDDKDGDDDDWECKELGRKECKEEKECMWNNDDKLCYDKKGKGEDTDEDDGEDLRCRKLDMKECKGNDDCKWDRDDEKCNDKKGKGEDTDEDKEDLRCRKLDMKECKGNDDCKWDKDAERCLDKKGKGEDTDEDDGEDLRCRKLDMKECKGKSECSWNRDTKKCQKVKQENGSPHEADSSDEPDEGGAVDSSESSFKDSSDNIESADLIADSSQADSPLAPADSSDSFDESDDSSKHDSKKDKGNKEKDKNKGKKDKDKVKGKKDIADGSSDSPHEVDSSASEGTEVDSADSSRGNSQDSLPASPDSSDSAAGHVASEDSSENTGSKDSSAEDSIKDGGDSPRDTDGNDSSEGQSPHHAPPADLSDSSEGKKKGNKEKKSKKDDSPRAGPGDTTVITNPDANIDDFLANIAKAFGEHIAVTENAKTELSALSGDSVWSRHPSEEILDQSHPAGDMATEGAQLHRGDKGVSNEAPAAALVGKKPRGNSESPQEIEDPASASQIPRMDPGLITARSGWQGDDHGSMSGRSIVQEHDKFAESPLPKFIPPPPASALPGINNGQKAPSLAASTPVPPQGISTTTGHDMVPRDHRLMADWQIALLVLLLTGAPLIGLPAVHAALIFSSS